jgi:hypothetical protein
MLLPAVATVALGTALLVPLRDDRQGRRATLARGKTPLRPDFDTHADQSSGAATTHGQEQTSPAARQPSDAEAFLGRQSLSSEIAQPSGERIPLSFESVPVSGKSGPPLFGSIPTSFEAVSLSGKSVPPSFRSVPPSFESLPLTFGSVPPSVDRFHRDARKDAQQIAIECLPASNGIAHLDERSDGSQDAAQEMPPVVDRDSNDPAATRRTALLEPFALISAAARPLVFIGRPLIFLIRPLTVLTRPLTALKDACLRLVNFEGADTEKHSGAAPLPISIEADSATPVERSFDAELSALLGQPSPPLVLDAPRVPAPEDGAGSRTRGNTASYEFGEFAAPEPSPEVLVPASSADTVSALTNEASSASTKDVRSASTKDVRSASTKDVRSASTKDVRFASTEDAQYALADAVETAGPEALIVAARTVRIDRVVPLTRLPLRPQGIDITWPDGVAEFALSGVPSRTERHALLERAVRDRELLSGEVAALAYRQEDGACRTLALRVMLRHFPHAGRAIFIEALRVGSDEERAIAIDGLATVGARDELGRGVGDRVDAIAAKAALAYVGTLDRADYRVELSAFIDATQIETILKLLAGIVE